MMSDMNPVVPSTMMFNEPYQPIHSNHHESNVTATNDNKDSNTNNTEDSNNNSNNKKRTRVTPSQLTVLEETFNITATPDSKMRKQLAAKLQMPERSIQIWFQNRRAKVKMLHKRHLLRQEQDAARGRLYGNSSLPLHNQHVHQHHHHPQQHPYQCSPYQYPNPAMARVNTPLPYWYGKYPQYPQYRQKLPIHRAWSIDSNHQQFVPPQQHPTTLSSSSSATTLSQPFTYEANNSTTIATTTATATATHSNSISSYSSDNNPSTLIMSTSSGLAEMTVSPSPTPQSFQPKRVESEPLTSSTTALFSSLSMDPSYLQCPEENEEGYITATALTIGSWHRMKIDQQDLTCSYNMKSRSFSWHIRDNNYHFKMTVPFDSIHSIELNVLDDNITAQVDLDVIEPPQFFMEKANTTSATTVTTMNNDEANGWVQCSDFTEGMQASVVLRHTIRGLATDLRQELLTIAGVDDRLCQITQFPSSSHPNSSIMNFGGSASVPPPVNIGLLTNTAITVNDDTSLLSHMDYTSSNGLLNPHQQNYWRHQSLPPSALMTNTLSTNTNTDTPYSHNNSSSNFFNANCTTTAAVTNAHTSSLHHTSYPTLDTI